MKPFKALLILFFVACSISKVPKERFSPYELGQSYAFTEDVLKIELKNSLQCPMRIWVQSQDPKLKIKLKDVNPILLKPLRDTSFQLEVQDIEIKEIDFASRFGDIEKKIEVKKLALPFPKGRSYTLIQGYNSTPTHNTDWSKYALDFGLAIGDTICTATSGYVVGVVEDYKDGGEQEEWRDYANYITIYDPISGLFTQYVHLAYQGSLVAHGDQVKAGDNIGISGMTGYTNIAHLHFNCLQPIHSQDGLISIPIDSIGNYKTAELKRKQLIINN